MSEQQSLIAYLRVSTTKQGDSGLGLEAQQAAIADYAASVGAEVLETFTEVESGRRKDRPQLAAAICRAKKEKAKLVVAKLDRLSRNVAFTAQLMDEKLDFVACDNPHVTPFTIHILAAVAQQEAEATADRTRRALKAAKARGVRLGNPKWKESVAGARTAKSALAAERAERLAAIIRQVSEVAKVKDLSGIARVLEARGIRTPSGKTTWHAKQVGRILARVA